MARASRATLPLARNSPPSTDSPICNPPATPWTPASSPSSPISRPDFFDRPLTYTNSAGQQFTDDASTAVAHLFNHQTHHRGQVHVMLSQTSVTPPALDLHRIIPSLICLTAPRPARACPVFHHNSSCKSALAPQYSLAEGPARGRCRPSPLLEQGDARS